MHSLLGNKKRLAALSLATVLGVCAWWQYRPIVAWYCVSRLAEADEASREAWIESVVGLDQCSVPRLLVELATPSEVRCNNVAEALKELVRKWGREDPRAQALVGEMKNRFLALSLPGKSGVLGIAATLLKEFPADKKVPSALLRDVGDLVQAARSTPELVVPVLVLAGALVERAVQGQWHDDCRQLALEAIRHEDARTRVAAIHVALRGPLRHDLDLLSRIAPLLADRDADVRHAAVLVLSSARDVLGDDELLPLLHDADVRVQQVAEMALRSRGLDDSQLDMARLISDPRPQGRLQVLQHLRQASDLDPGVWLRRLCQDSSPAVRAAAVRAAVQQQCGLGDRLAEMAGHDPSPTVRELAGYYWLRTQNGKDH